MIKKLKILCRGHKLVMMLMEKKLLDRFIKMNCKKQIKKFRIEKVVKRKGNKLYGKWKGYKNSFNSWNDYFKKTYKWVNNFQSQNL